MRKFLLFFLLITCYGCSTTNRSTSPYQKIEQLEWLLGNWSDTNGGLYEIWTKANDSVYVGKSFVLAEQDTVFYETISLRLMRDSLFYIPVVRNQNSGKPVMFVLIPDSTGAFVFENKRHDFPQRIVYENPTPDSLYARIEGNENGIFRKEKFAMAKE